MMLLKLSAVSTQTNLPNSFLTWLIVVSELWKGKEVKICLCVHKVNVSELY